jgi:dynein heavy chain
LIKDLGGEKKRWKELEIKYFELKKLLVGDILIASGLIAYLGPFNMVYRKKIAE